MRNLILWSLFQALFFGMYANAQIPQHVSGTMCFTKTFWCWATRPGAPGTVCGCPTSAGYIEGTIEGRSATVAKNKKIAQVSSCQKALLSASGYELIGNGTFGRVEKDDSITLLYQNGKSKNVLNNGGCNSGKQKLSDILKENLANFDKAFKATISLPENQRLIGEFKHTKDTLEICRIEESDSAWYKEAMADAPASSNNTAVKGAARP